MQEAVPELGLSLSRLQNIVVGNASFFKKHLSLCEVVKVAFNAKEELTKYTVKFEDGTEHAGVSRFRTERSGGGEVGAGNGEAGAGEEGT